MKPDVQFQRLSHPAPNQIEQLHAIYLDSFPSFERVEFASLLGAIQEDERWLFVAMRGKVVIGLAITVPNIAPDFHLLEYLAVLKTARGCGIGGILLSYVIASMRATGSVNGMLLEVESDEEGAAEERRLRERRIGFYQRIGARAVECAPYYRVPLTDRPGMMRMKLLWIATHDNTQPPHGAKLRECIRGIMEKSYGLDADSALAESNLDELIC